MKNVSAILAVVFSVVLVGGLAMREIAVPKFPETKNKKNNPGNLKYAGQRGAKKGKNDFAIFSSAEDGWTALTRDLQIKINSGDYKTLEQLIHRWAPASDGNNPQNYAQFVANELRINATTEVKCLRYRIPELAIAIAKFEGSI